MLDTDTSHNLLKALWLQASQHGFLYEPLVLQFLCLVGALLFGLVAHRYLKPWVMERQYWGSRGISRIFLPLATLLALFCLDTLLLFFYEPPHQLVELANILLLAMLSIRLAVYLLQNAFNNPPWLLWGERYISTCIWGLYVLYVTGILTHLVEVLDGLRITVGSASISVMDILNGVWSVVLTLLVAMWLGRLIERRLMRSSLMDMNVRVVLVKLLRSLLIVLAITVTLPLVGIDLTVLSVFGGALGVGLGFGLQKIASNYVSGFIILLDRSIKLGDLIQIDNRQGIITGLTSRYIVLKSLDGTEALVPNDTLVTSTVVNQSYNDRSVYVKMPIAVAYESDLELVMSLLLNATDGQNRIARNPPPRAFIESFGDSGVNMLLGFWVTDPENGLLGLRSDVYRQIWNAFRVHQISIPFNRLDVALFTPANPRAGDGNLQMTVK